MIDISWPHLKTKLKEAVFILPQFAKNPVRGMQNLPDWDWPTLLILQTVFAAITATIANLVERDLLGLITGLVIGPITTLLVTVVFSGFFFYFFLFVLNREIDFRKIYTHLVFASIPLLTVSVIGGLIPPIFLLGATASMLLLYVGFVANFDLPRERLKQILIGLLVVYVLFWAWTMIGYSKKHKSLRQRASPESLDILEKELNDH